MKGFLQFFLAQILLPQDALPSPPYVILTSKSHGVVGLATCYKQICHLCTTKKNNLSRPGVFIMAMNIRLGGCAPRYLFVIISSSREIFEVFPQRLNATHVIHPLPKTSSNLLCLSLSCFRP